MDTVLVTVTRTLEVPGDELSIVRSKILFSVHLNYFTFSFRFLHDNIGFPRLVNLRTTQERHEVILSKLDFDRAPIQLSTRLLTNLTRRHEPPDFVEHVIIQNDFSFLVVGDVPKIIHVSALLVRGIHPLF